MAKEENQGCFWGIDKEGNVDRVWQYRRGSSTYLVRGTYRHLIEHNRTPKNEVVIVFGFTEIEHVPQFAIGTDSEKQVIEDLKAKAAVKKSAL